MTPAGGLLISDDLLDISRIAATARATGLSLLTARTGAAALELAATSPPAGVVVDLHNPGLDLPGLLAGLRAVCPAMPRVVAFGSHVDAERLRAARAAGCDRVMPRSQFVRDLEGGLKAWLATDKHGSNQNQ